MAALPEDQFRMRFLEITSADLTAGNMCCDSQHRGHAAVGIIKAVDQVKVTGATAACAYGQFPGELCFCTGGKSSGLFVPVMDPFYFSTLADLFRNSVQRVAYNAVNTAYACFPQDGDKGCSNGT